MSRRLSIPLATLALLVAFGPAASVAQARDWGFTRDTVYEWGDTTSGRVRFVNNGAAPLALDSMFAEQTDKPWSFLLFKFVTTSVAGKSFLPAAPALALPDTFPAGGSALLLAFDVIPSTCTLKAAADTSLGNDTLAVRLRLRAASGEEDTLIVVGTSCSSLSVGIRPPLAPGRPGASRTPAVAAPRDALGRDRVPAKNHPTTLRR